MGIIGKGFIALLCAVIGGLSCLFMMYAIERIEAAFNWLADTMSYQLDMPLEGVQAIIGIFSVGAFFVGLVVFAFLMEQDS